MDIKRNCLLSPLVNHNKSTSENESPPSIFSLESDVHNSSPLIDISSSQKNGLLNEQLRLERDIAHQISIKTQDSFTKTYTSLQTILSQMQLKLANVFLQETEYLKYHEEQLEQEEQSMIKRVQQLKSIQNQRKQIENEFHKIKNQMETAVTEVIKFQTDGSQILQTLFHESHQIDEQLSSLISECLAALHRCRTMIKSKTEDFSNKSKYIQSELLDRQSLIRKTQLSITTMLELVDELNQFNNQHSQTVTIATIDFEKRYQQFTNLSETINHQMNIDKEMNEIHALENEKIQVEKELSEHILLLENIYTVLGKAIDR